MSNEPFTPTDTQVRDGYRLDPEDDYYNPLNAGANAERNGRAFDRWLAGVKKDARAGALISGAEIGWDAAVWMMQFEDGTKPDVVAVVNPYRQKENK